MREEELFGNGGLLFFGVTFERVGWFILFGWIIYGIAGLCVLFVFGPSGAGSLGVASAHPIPDLLSL